MNNAMNNFQKMDVHAQDLFMNILIFSIWQKHVIKYNHYNTLKELN